MSKVKYKSQGYGTQLCGQTCLSMITGKSISKICAELGKTKSTNILNDLKVFLVKKGYDTIFKKIRYFKEAPNNSIIYMEFQGENYKGHFTLKIDDKYYDPSNGIIKSYNSDKYFARYYLHYKNKI